ncbi:stalk domain-containing protein [Paenibacillus ferrarius]|nr:stalk domain-containing protein [Paenibacillus ferrarius]
MFKSKKMVVGLTSLIVASSFSLGAFADTALKQITAYQNSNLQVKVNGKAIDLSSEDGTMYPLVYDGHSYVSAKALAEAMGGKVSYDESSKTVNVTTNGYTQTSAEPTKDNSSNTVPPIKQDPPTTSTSKGSASPVKTYNSDVAASQIFEDNKAAASAVIQIYARALKTGDTSEINQWLKSNLVESEFGSTSYELTSKSIEKTLKATRAVEDLNVLGDLANSAIAAAKDQTFNKDSRSEGLTKSREADYFVDAVTTGYKMKFGVYLIYSLNNETNKFYFSQAVFY